MNFDNYANVEIPRILGPDPQHMERLVKRVYNDGLPDPDTIGTPQQLWVRSILTDRNKFFLKLTIMAVLCPREASMDALHLLRRFLTSRTLENWEKLQYATRISIKQILLGCIIHQVEESKLHVLSEIIGEIISVDIYQPMAVGPSDDIDISLFITECFYSDKRWLQIFALLVLGKAPRSFVVDVMLKSNRTEKLGYMSNRLGHFLKLMDDRKLYATSAVINLWVRLPLENKGAFLNIVNDIFTILPQIVYQHEGVVGEFLTMLTNQIENPFREGHVRTVMGSLMEIVEAPGLVYDTIHHAICLAVYMIRSMSPRSVELIIDNLYVGRLFTVLMHMMSSVESIIDDDDTLDVLPLFSLGKGVIGNLISKLGTPTFLRCVDRMIDSSMAAPFWRMRRAAITVVGMLSPHGMTQEHMMRVMDWILKSINDKDEKVRWRAGKTTMSHATLIKACHSNLYQLRGYILMTLSLSHFESDPRVKGCLQAAYEKLNGR